MEPEKDKEMLQAVDEKRLFDNDISKHTPSTEESSSAAANLEPEIWEVCAEGLVDLPKLNSLDHYFRQGHDASSMAAPSNNEREVNPESWQECAEGLVDLPKLDSMAALSSNQPEKDQEIISWNDLTWEEILQAVDDKRLFNNEDIPKHTEDHENVERQDNTLDNNIEAVNLQANLEPEHVEQPPSMESLSPSSSANHYFPQGHDTSLMAVPTSNNEREVNPEIWQACAGSLVDIPKLNSLVYYFPQGHMEHVQEEVLLDYPLRYGCCLCRVTNVSFHADPQTDQVFVKFLLEPWITDDNPNPSPSPSPSPSPIQMGGNDNDIVSFVKVLSNTDVARHFYVTDPFRKCIFSQLPTSKRQYILVTDINGKIWEITLQSYCTKFTNGWYDFVKIKNLTPGDYIVFMLKKSTNEYFVGIRRAVINIPIRVKDVEDAIEKVRNMKSFEVVYYPILGLPEFVVPKEKVDAALHVHWRREMSVKIAYEDFQCSEPEKRWFYGDILNDVNLEIDGFCPKSSWRILQVRWNVGPDVLKNMPNIQMNMSPWEVEALQPSHEELALSYQELLQACAGSFFDIPKVNSLVYYFPQGHVEHENASRYASLLCRVVNVSFHADPQIDHVFVKFLLNPSPISIPNPNPNPNPIQKGNNNDNVVSFVKVLRTSDVTFQLRVTRPLRDCIFTRIPNNAREYIKFTDIHGKIWEIMIEIKSEMPLYCVLSKGWLQFVETKNLKDGDSIVFMLKKSSNEYYVGIRRASVNRVISDNFGLETKSNFEVVYYPILGLPEFVVPKEKVDAQMVSRNSIRIAE